MQLEVRVRKLVHDAILPAKAHDDDAGYDLFSIQEMIIHPGKSALVPTGIAIALPPKTEAQIRPRSGLALREGVTVLNTPGTIDAGYRGEIGVILINHGAGDFTITKGMKIAQMVIARIPDTCISEVSDLDITQRGNDGFGSTGL